MLLFPLGRASGMVPSDPRPFAVAFARAEGPRHPVLEAHRSQRHRHRQDGTPSVPIMPDSGFRSSVSGRKRCIAGIGTALRCGTGSI